MKKKHGQMSEALLTAALLSVSGGTAGCLHPHCPGARCSPTPRPATSSSSASASSRGISGAPDTTWCRCWPSPWASLTAELVRWHFQGTGSPLAAAGGAGGDRPALPGGLCLPSDLAGQRPGVLRLRHAGPGLPQGGWLRLRQHHVHRQPPQRRGVPLRLGPDPEPESSWRKAGRYFAVILLFALGAGLGELLSPGMVGRQGHLALLRPAGGELPADVHPGGPGGEPGHSGRGKQHPSGAAANRSGSSQRTGSGARCH